MIPDYLHGKKIVNSNIKFLMQKRIGKIMGNSVSLLMNFRWNEEMYRMG